MRLDTDRRTEFAERRQRIIQSLGRGAMILVGAQSVRRNADTEFEFRQDSSFLYLTGFNEPGAVCVLRGEAPHFVMFVPPKDKVRETWDGRRAGVSGAMEVFGADAAHSVKELGEKLPDYLENLDTLWAPWGEGDELIHGAVGRALSVLRMRRRKRVSLPKSIADASAWIAELRACKSPLEIQLMEVAARATHAGHEAAMLETRPGMTEFDVQRILEDGFRRAGCRFTAYPSIVGAGDNATVLHYRENSAELMEGDLLLIDAGAEFDGYACDVTRTFPVGLTFTRAQKELYEIVLQAQLDAIAASRAGVTMESIHDVALAVIEDGLLRLGIITERKDATGARLVERYFMHRTSHFLGLDVHDAGRTFADGQPLALPLHSVITVEPGVYIPAADELAPEEYRGIGIRIEDDVLLEADGCRVLTQNIAKTVEEIEALRRRNRTAA